ncbi:MAG: 50S ribosomal protein L22 [Fusobacteriaceae bacterium]|nr:50S ribosomal protein L22 [Fusobacteriaceae bacterium]
MEAKAITRYVRMSPTKARLVADLIRGKEVLKALDILEFTNKKAAKIIKKTLTSAMHNATNNFKMNEDKLVVSQILVNQGPVLKRLMPRAQGRADIQRKPTAHVTVVVSEVEKEETKEIKETKEVTSSGTKS